MGLREISMLASIFFSSPGGASDCCEIYPTREAYCPIKETPKESIDYMDQNTYAVREEDIEIPNNPHGKGSSKKKTLALDKKYKFKGQKRGELIK